MNDQELLDCAMDIGEEMLRCGAEIGRVEDTVERIGLAYGCTRVDVFTITSSIVVTLHRTGDAVTQTRRIYAHLTDLERLRRLNALSRGICAQTPELDKVRAEFQKIVAMPATPLKLQYAAFALTAGAFSVFFGGTLGDAMISSVIGMLLKWLSAFAARMRLNSVISNVFLSFAGGAMALLALQLGLGSSYDRIVIGDIMLLIPGIALTNALRDMFDRDLISGIQRLCEALLMSAAIAVGFALAQKVIL